MSSYADFLASKRRGHVDAGKLIDPSEVHPSLFGFQRDIVVWAVRKGRAAVFADTGLGKTRMQIEWARLAGERTLILAPLAVCQQTIAEAASIGVPVAYARDQADVSGTISITNYERLDRFRPAAFGAVVLDESSILKAFSGVTKRALIVMFRNTRYRLCCTATPAPNDLEELSNHADFLGIMKSNEMRSTFFIADSRGEFMKYRLKRHAKDAFFRWLASWALAIKRPSDLGYEDDGYVLPGLTIEPHFIASDYRPDDALFSVGTKGVGETAAIRRGTVAERVARTLEIVNAEPTERWLIWCGRNDESNSITAAIPGAVNVEGSQTAEYKAEQLGRFANGEIRVLVTKPGLAAFGMNFQTCARMAFIGLGYSYEQYYQALRRCHRFGQTREVVAHIVLTDLDRDIFDVVQAKEATAQELSHGLLAELHDHELAELYAGTSKGDDYEPTKTPRLPRWLEIGVTQ